MKEIENNIFTLMKKEYENLYGVDRYSNCLLFYDESNNVRKLKLNKNGTNNDAKHLFFVFGGIAIPNNKYCDLDAKILEIIPEKERIGEKKFSYFSNNKKDFEMILKSSRLLKLFKFLNEYNIFIHVKILHFIYWSLIDLLDSMLLKNDLNNSIYMSYHLIMKSDFIEVVYKNYDELLKLLYEFNYPSINKDKIFEFIKSIYNLYLNNYEKYYSNNHIENFSKELLRQMIKSTLNEENLYLLDEEKSLVLCDDLYLEYIEAMLILNDKKIFDNERKVEEQLKNIDNEYLNKTNSCFVDSKSNIGVQLSDSIVGFIGKLFFFLSENSIEDLIAYANNLKYDDIELHNLKIFYLLFNKSVEYNPFFIGRSIPLYIEKKFKTFFNIIIKKTTSE